MKQIICIEIKGNKPASYRVIDEATLRKLVADGTIALKQDILEKMLISNEPIWTDGYADFFILGIRKQ